ncbi:hypothetical protein BAMY6639_00615 [Bacillus amyloliquefaciens UMAF6639]|nr:hypothetical protein BAMY6639_00615 [Bacillus amyloliquefaciens UMAF6639]
MKKYEHFQSQLAAILSAEPRWILSTRHQIIQKEN